MLLMSCADLSRAFDADPLFLNLGFELYNGERVGLIGPNGVGKTTLLRILAGLDQPDTGEVRLHAGARASLLAQQPDFEEGRGLFDEARSALDELLAAHEEMVQTAEALAKAQSEAERKSLSARYDRLTEMLHFYEAYNVDHRVRQVLEGLGFQSEDYERAVTTFSGGQQSRLMLAKLLLSAPDVLLLDEPSNHLDIAATRWLEDYLVQQPEAMIIVSHDRYFLDRVANKIFELHQGQIESYTGNYQAYWRQRQERYEQKLQTWLAQKEYVEKQEEYIRRVHYGQLHKQAQSRQKALDRLERVEKPTLVSAPQMHFGDVRRTGDIVVRADDLGKSYDKPLFQHLSFALERGKRLGIMGPNGSGKTTLLRVLLGEVEADEGTLELGHRVQLGYYDQHLQSLDADKEVIRAAFPESLPQTTEQGMRDLLARFGLVGDIVFQKVDKLSGGERSRAALAKLVAEGANVLVFDEPTNHLDLWACDSLEQALLNFEGTVIVVSHDRFFLNRVVDMMLVLEGNGVVRVVHGNYDMYERMRAHQDAPAAAVKEDDKPRQAATAPKQAKRKRRFPYRKANEIEADIAEQETQLQEVEKLIASSDLYKDGDRVKETMQRFEEIKARLASLYEHWEEALELN